MPTRNCWEPALGAEIFAVLLNRLSSVNESVPPAVVAGFFGLLNVLALPSELEGLACARPIVLDCSLRRRPVRDGVRPAGSLDLGAELLGGLAVKVDLDVEVWHGMVPFCYLNHPGTKYFLFLKGLEWWRVEISLLCLAGNEFGELLAGGFLGDILYLVSLGHVAASATVR
jgi:hypothetical protein